jgi:AcrR family transcriptional regulator
VTTDHVTRGRRYRGETPEQRAAARRERLLAAALELYGRRGHVQPTIAQLCARAHVTTRNFYEAFASRNDLLLALYEHLLAEQARRLVGAFAALDRERPLSEQTRPVLEALVRPWAEDVRKARVAQLEIRGVGPEIDARTFAALDGFATMVARQAGVSQQVALALVGAVNGSLMMWHVVPDEQRPDIEEVIDALEVVVSRTLGA